MMSVPEPEVGAGLSSPRLGPRGEAEGSPQTRRELSCLSETGAETSHRAQVWPGGSRAACPDAPGIPRLALAVSPEMLRAQSRGPGQRGSGGSAESIPHS